MSNPDPSSAEQGDVITASNDMYYERPTDREQREGASETTDEINVYETLASSGEPLTTAEEPAYATLTGAEDAGYETVGGSYNNVI